jgi:hypothetical protein
MSLELFCDYVSANPGGARKAFELRKEAGGDCGGKEKVVVYRDRVVERVIKVGRKKNLIRWIKYPCVTLVLLGAMGFMMGPSDNVVGPVVVKEVPVEVVKEVVVEDPDLVRQVRMLENRISQMKVDHQTVLDIKDMDSRELQRQIKMLQSQIDRRRFY